MDQKQPNRLSLVDRKVEKLFPVVPLVPLPDPDVVAELAGTQGLDNDELLLDPALNAAAAAGLLGVAG